LILGLADIHTIRIFCKRNHPPITSIPTDMVNLSWLNCKCVNNVILLRSYVTFPVIKLLNFNEYLKIIVMTLLTILIVLIVAGVLLWLVNSFIPMDNKIKTILNIVVVIVVVVWLLKEFGLFNSLMNLKV
jgi:hypothetical protein